ncbi:MAG: hypothetical protein AB7S38_36940 [Vulcanimicrobiota bacterium]
MEELPQQIAKLAADLAQVKTQVGENSLEIKENRRGIEENRREIEENRRGIEENRHGIQENRRLLEEHSQWMARKDQADAELMEFLREQFQQQDAKFAMMAEEWRSDHRAVVEVVRSNSRRIDRLEQRLGID